MTEEAAGTTEPPAAADSPVATEPPSATRDIVASVVVAVPPEAVWRAITEGEQVANWFAPVASARPGQGGHLTVSWGGGAEWTSWITAWDPCRHLRLVDRLPEDAADGGAAMALDYRLTDLGGTTRLDLVNSGLSAEPAWDDTFHMMHNGWRFFLWNLRHYLERHPGTRRTMISERPWVTGSREEVWDRVFGETGLGTSTADGSQPAFHEVGDLFRFKLDGGISLEGTVVVCDRPWAFAGVVASLNDGVIHVEMEGSGDRWKAGVWLSCYGVEKKQCQGIAAALSRTVSRVFPGDG